MTVGGGWLLITRRDERSSLFAHWRERYDQIEDEKHAAGAAYHTVALIHCAHAERLLREAALNAKDAHSHEVLNDLADQFHLLTARPAVTEPPKPAPAVCGELTPTDRQQIINQCVTAVRNALHRGILR